MRLTLLQLILLATFFGLLAGLARTSWQLAQFPRPWNASVSPDGTRVAIVVYPGKIVVWDLSASPRIVGDVIPQQHHGPTPWMRDADTLIVPLWNQQGTWEMQHWSVSQEKLLRRVPLPQFILDEPIASSRNGKFAVFRHANATVAVCMTSEGEQLATIATGDSTRLAISHDGRRIAVPVLAPSLEAPVQTLQMQIEDSHTGEVIKRLPVYHSNNFALDPRGDLLAIYHAETGDWSLDIWEVSSGKKKQSILLSGTYSENVEFSPDGSRVLVGSPATIYDVDTGKQIAKVGSEPYFNFLKFLDNDRVLAINQHRAAIYSAQDGRTIRQLWNRQGMLHFVMFAVGLGCWSWVWGHVQRRERLRRHPGKEPARSLPLRIQSNRLPPGTSPLVVFLALTLLALFVSIIYDDSHWHAILLIGTPLFAALLTAAIVGSIHWLRRRGRGPAYRDISFAMHACRRIGRTHRLGCVTAWFDGASQIEPRLEAELDSTAERFAELFQQPTQWTRPVLILSFDRHEHLQKFQNCPLAGLYYGWIDKQILFCESRALELLQSPRNTFRALLAYHLTVQTKGFLLPPWLQQYVNMQCWDLELSRNLLVAAHRRLRVAPEQDEELSAEFLFGTGNAQLVDWMFRFEHSDAYQNANRFLDMVHSFGHFLDTHHPSDKGRMAHVLRSCSRGRKSVEALVREQFRAAPEQLHQAWQEWRRQQPLDGFPVIDPQTRRFLIEWSLPKLADPETPVALRSRIARYVGTLGDPVAAEPLIACLETPPAPEEETFHQDVQRALELLAGERHPAEAWRTWLATIPPESRQAQVEIATGQLPGHSPDHSPPSIPEHSSIPTEAGMLAPPLLLSICWTWMMTGGVIALAIGLGPLLLGEAWWLPTSYLSVLTGVMAISQATARSGRLELVGTLMVLNVLTCDVIGCILGFFILYGKQTPEIRDYLRAITPRTGPKST